MDCSSLRSYLKNELPGGCTHETLSNCILAYFSHKGMEWTADDVAVIREYGENPEDYLTFDENQLFQLEKVEQAAQALIDVLCNVPEYLSSSYVQDGKPIHPLLLADMVAEILSHDVSHVFLPTHVCTEDEKKTEYISDLYNK